MRTSVAALLGAVTVIVILSLLFAVHVASRNAPPHAARATGPHDACRTNADCACASFDGAEFIPGQFTPSTCEKNGYCATCLYE